MPRSSIRSLPGLRPRGLARRATAVLAVTATALTAAVALTATAASATPVTTTLFEESFTGATTTVPSWVMPTGSTGNAACLTAGTDSSQQPIPGCNGSWMYQPDEAGQGVLRLTTPDYSQVGAAFYDAGLPSAKGIDVSFDSYQWYYGGVIPADGISFVLAATDPTNPSAPASAGAPGAGLGYAPTSGMPGVPNGYLGFGLDVVGNFAATNFGYDGTCPSTGAQSQSLVVRGPGNGTNGYCLLSATASNGPLDQPWQFDRPVAVPVEIVLNPEDHDVVSSGGVTVPARSWLAAWTPYGADKQTASGDLPTADDLATAGIPAEWFDPTTNLPYQLSFGWAGSTGAGYSFHAVSNVRATTLTGQLPVYQLAVSDSADGSFTSGRSGAVTVTPSLAASGGDESRAATVTTTLPDGLVPTTPVTTDYDCTTVGQVVSCTTTAASYAAGSVLPTVTIPVTVGGAPLGAQAVTAKVSSTDGNPATARHDVFVRTDQAITFAPLTSPAAVSGHQQLVTTGGGSTAPVTFAVGSATTNAACSIQDDVLTFDHVGTCVVTADQAGDAEHNAAPQVAQSVTVELNATTTSLALSSSVTVYGQPVSATATVGGSTAGTVQFSVDGQPVGDAVPLSDDGTASSGLLTATGGAVLAPGAHPVSAVFTPTSTTTHASSVSTPQTVTVSQAATTTTVTVGPSTLTAHVGVTAPGAGSPTGTIGFTVDGTPVGSAPVVDGVATLAYATPADQSRQVAATYPGSTDFLASSGSSARTNPVITARLSSPSTRSTYGWYRSPVTVSFSCAAGSAPLVGTCPAPVTLSGNGASQGVTRTVTTTDGGVATVALGGINIDLVVPVVRLTGVTSGARYFASSPSVKCVGADTLSGLASCSVRKQRSGEVETITASAVDKAGNTATTRVQVRVVSMMIQGAPYANGVYTLRKGRTYTVLVLSTTRPRYVDAALCPRTPHGLDHYFTKVGTNRWAIGVTMDRGMRTGYWNLGVKIGSTTRSIKAYVKP